MIIETTFRWKVWVAGDDGFQGGWGLYFEGHKCHVQEYELHHWSAEDPNFFCMEMALLHVFLEYPFKFIIKSRVD